MSNVKGGGSDISFDKPVQFTDAQTEAIEDVLNQLASLDRLSPELFDPIQRAALRPLSIWAKKVLGEPVELCGCQ